MRWIDRWMGQRLADSNTVPLSSSMSYSGWSPPRNPLRPTRDTLLLLLLLLLLPMAAWPSCCVSGVASIAMARWW